MSGLALISTYSDEEHEDRKKDITHNNRNTQQFGLDVGEDRLKPIEITVKKLPLPSSILDIYKDRPIAESIPEDDPSLHDGRIRSFPHKRGNWSTYVFVPYKQSEGYGDLLTSLQECAAQQGVDLELVADPHISLTRTVILLHHWIDSFISTVRAKLSHLTRFTVLLGPLAVYCNEERTRTFLGFSVQLGSNHLCEAALKLDECLAEFRLPPFYKEPSFHMSVLWVVGDQRSLLEAVLPKLNAQFEVQFEDHPHLFHLDVTECLCKTGNKSFTFSFAPAL